MKKGKKKITFEFIFLLETTINYNARIQCPKFFKQTNPFSFDSQNILCWRDTFLLFSKSAVIHSSPKQNDAVKKWQSVLGQWCSAPPHVMSNAW